MIQALVEGLTVAESEVLKDVVYTEKTDGLKQYGNSLGVQKSL